MTHKKIQVTVQFDDAYYKVACLPPAAAADIVLFAARMFGIQLPSIWCVAIYRRTMFPLTNRGTLLRDGDVINIR